MRETKNDRFIPIKEIRFNASLANSVRLRKVQVEYSLKFPPAKVSLDALANLAIEHGIDKARMKLNLS